MLRVIFFVISVSSCEAREESDNYNMKKGLPSVGLEPIISCLLDWRSNQLHHGTAVIVNILGKLYPY